MKASQLSQLEQHIEAFIESVAKERDGSTLIHPELSQQMALAAAQVYDAMDNAQIFYMHEKPKKP